MNVSPGDWNPYDILEIMLGFEVPWLPTSYILNGLAVAGLESRQRPLVRRMMAALYLDALLEKRAVPSHKEWEWKLSARARELARAGSALERAAIYEAHVADERKRTLALVEEIGETRCDALVESTFGTRVGWYPIARIDVARRRVAVVHDHKTVVVPARAVIAVDTDRTPAATAPQKRVAHTATRTA